MSTSTFHQMKVADEQFIKSLETLFRIRLVTYLIQQIVHHLTGSDDSEENIYQKIHSYANMYLQGKLPDSVN